MFRIAFELIEVIVLLSGFLLLFYLFMEFVFPFFTRNIKPGWLFFAKWQEKKKVKKENEKQSETEIK
jgi:hypothetical protein